MSDDEDGGIEGDLPESLLPYDEWVEDAYRDVMVRALEHVVAEGLPGGHHFYITFLTALPGVEIPQRLRAQYPHDMTIVLEHQFWDLRVDRERRLMSVGLSFGRVGTTLVIPFSAITAFADPHVHMALRFSVEVPEADPAVVSDPDATDATSPASGSDDTVATLGPTSSSRPVEERREGEDEAQVVSLDAFRRRTPPSGERG